ncbi:MAG: YggS family pyridoxal phosphate-dependent enzyme [Terriglobia bacterium]
MGLQENILRVRERIEAACRRSGRRPEEVRLVAVSKTFPAGRIREAFEGGLRDFGENRVQECAQKKPLLGGLDITWHLIGHLQTNKAQKARSLFNTIHSVDSLRVASALHAASPNSENRLPILLQVNLAEEATKFGLREEEAPEIAEAVSRLPSLELRGLMLIPPLFESPERARPYFRRLRELAEKIAGRRLQGVSMRDLSMGMSQDFETAIEEGATMVRVGAAIFGPR